MIPVLVGLGVAAAGAALLSDDKPKGTDSQASTLTISQSDGQLVEETTRTISENQIPQSMFNRMKIKGENDLNNLNPYVFDKVKEILSEKFNVYANAQMNIENFSLAHRVIFFTLCEEEFDIEIPDEQVKKVRTVADVVNLIDSLC